MRKVMFHIALILLVQGSIFAGTSDVLPLSGIAVGMSSKALLDKYPTDDFVLTPKIENQVLMQGIAVYDFTTNKFWDTLWVHIDGAKVRSLNYLNDDDDKMVKNVKSLFKQLKQSLGATFEKKVTYGETKSRCAMYVWKREKDVVAFSHSPIAKHKKGDIFYCQLTIASKLEDMGALFKNMATDNAPEDAKLWADAMDE